MMTPRQLGIRNPLLTVTALVLAQMVGTQPAQFKDLRVGAGWRSRERAGGSRMSERGHRGRIRMPTRTSVPCTVPRVVVVTGTLQKAA
jgi:hypothetical protein